MEADHFWVTWVTRDWKKFGGDSLPCPPFSMVKSMVKPHFAPENVPFLPAKWCPLASSGLVWKVSKAQTPAVKSQVEGRSFLDFISPADRQRFVDVVQTSSIHESPAGSLSVHLVDSSCEVRLYHARWQQGGFTTIKPWHGWFFE